jgi:peptide chain release factor 3
MSASVPAPAGVETIAEQAARRRTFAIISHPDAGKTTLTEKLLLYGGAIAQAGTVRSRAGGRSTTSDWMELERRRGISISSTALRFERDGLVFNLLDTPGHHDFSEDTLRVLSAVDAAVILIDAAKGIEDQTRRLFDVARARAIPLITFANKLDRPSMEPLALVDHLHETLGIDIAPLTWPVTVTGRFSGVIDRHDRSLHRFARTVHGATVAESERLTGSGARDAGGAGWEVACEELSLLDAVGAHLSAEAFLAGRCTPLLFGSAVWNFGVQLLLEVIAQLAPPPSARPAVEGVPRDLQKPFSAQVFKVQANMDLRHRDRLCYMRVCSGRFDRGMRATVSRTGRQLRLAHAHEVFARDRDVVDEAFPGDVVGVINAADVRVGDTLHAVGSPVRFPALPTLAPEHFRRARNRTTARHKQFHAGLRQLDQEGVVHVLRRNPAVDPEPVLGAVGPLQFEVVTERMRTEFGVEIALDSLDYTLARRTDSAGAETVRVARGPVLMYRSDASAMALFTSTFALEHFAREHPHVRLEHILADDLSLTGSSNP